MKKNYKNRKLGKLLVAMLFFTLVTMSATQAMNKIYSDTVKTLGGPSDMFPLNDDYYYTWEDDFDNEQWIDSTKSYDYETSGGIASMKNTYSIWSDSSWTKMVPIIVNNNVGETLTSYAVQLTIEYDSDMDSYYHDIRFKHEDFATQWLDYWIETYDSNSAEIWVNIPSLPTGQSKMYLFYGNPGAQDESDFYAVFSEWGEEWANDEKISTHVYSEDAEDPDVAYGNDRFIIVWEEGQELYLPYTLFWKHDIRGSIYDTSGNPIKVDFEIRSGQGDQWRHENPSVAYGGGKFFVVWEHYATSTGPQSRRLLGKMVSTSGSVGDQIIICEEDNIQADPCVAFDSNTNRFCVVWEDARHDLNNYNIYGKLYDINGNQIGNEKEICIASNNQYEPWVTFDNVNNQYMIVWEEQIDDFEFDIVGGLFDTNLNQIKNVQVADGSSTECYLYPAVGFCEENERFLVTYNGGTQTKPRRGNVYGKIYDESGNLKASTIIKQGSFIRTDVAPYLSTSFLISFNGGGNIWGRFLSSEDGTVYNDEYRDIQLSASPSAEADWANMAVNNNEIFVVWEDARVDYAFPFEEYADVYGNMWHLNIGDGSEVTCSIGSEKQLILEAQITSKEITFENNLHWYDFDAIYEGSVTFDILNNAGNQLLMHNVNPGADISSLGSNGIRLRAHLTRTNPSYTPNLDCWTVRYVGKDDEPPRTSIDFIDSVKGEHEWYIEESVTIWLHAEDFPEDTGSGIDKTYYTLNYGSTQEYNEASGIHLATSQESNWMGQWEVNFWSVDKSNNVENKNRPENKLNIKIDAEHPYVEITEPIDEQKVNVPFWVRADAFDNAEIDRVEFDIEPFGERPGILPYVDNTPPYEWECNVGPKSIVHSLLDDDDPQPAGVNVMVRAQVYDKSGQTWIHQVWVYVENWGRIDVFENSMCFVLAQGTETTAKMQSNKNEKMINTDVTALGSFVFGDINWEYITGFCLSAGLEGMHSVNGAHSGTANKFFGVANKNVIVGVASYVCVER